MIHRLVSVNQTEDNFNKTLNIIKVIADTIRVFSNAIIPIKHIEL